MTAGYYARRQRLIRAGTYQPPMDAEPVRDHVRGLLDARFSMRALATAADVPLTTLQWLLDPKLDSKQINADAGRRLLAITLDAIPDANGVHLNSVGSRRRVQALAAIGWSLPSIAAEAGLSKSAVEKVMRSDRVAASTDRAIRRAYRVLSVKQPNPVTPQERRAVSRTLTRARRLGWASPAAWGDDIDDPNARPRGVRREVAA